MSLIMNILIPLHVLAAVVWVGGMFFAYMALRPVAAEKLDPPARLTLWAGVFGKFFPWVWMSIVILLATGLWVVINTYGGFANVSTSVHTMFGLGIVMILMFGHVYFALYKKLVVAVAEERWPDGGSILSKMRIMIAINLTIGLVTVFVAVSKF